MSIFNKLKLSKSPKELGESIDSIDAEISSTEARITALEQSREKVLFEDGEAAITKLQKDIVGGRDHLELLQIARRGAVARQAEAESAQRQRELEARHREAVKQAAEERRLLKLWHKAAETLAGLSADLEVLQLAGSKHNADMCAAGRPDLIVPKIIHEINARRQAALEKYCADRGQRAPSNGITPIPTEAAHMCSIPFYFPVPDFDPVKTWAGPPLAFLD